MDAFSTFVEHSHKLFGSTAQLALPNRRVLEGHTLEIGADGVKLIVSENLPAHLDGLVRLSIPAKPTGAHTIIAHVRTLYSVFDSTGGGFLVSLKFTEIPVESVKVIAGYLEG
jgi:hypothetical protein